MSKSPQLCLRLSHAEVFSKKLFPGEATEMYWKKIWHIVTWSDNELKGIWFCSFRVGGISLSKSVWVECIWRDSVQKRLKKSTLNFTHTFKTDCSAKGCMHFFLILSYSFFIALAWRGFERKQLKADYSKNTWKEQKRRHPFWFTAFQ